ncbi:MAG TPA: glycosyltransferase family 2 protein [Daejeonella sp.]|nr:glycosyltransferase family 2 protein [Daejeonella sp.]
MSGKTVVILVNWNSFEYTHQCLISLEKCNSANFDIIVVDNGSIDSSAADLKREHPGIILIQSDTNLGFAGGNNLGIQYALKRSYTYLMLLNNDTFVEPDFIDVLVSYMDDHPETGVIQPKIYCNHNRSLLWNGGSYFIKFLGLSYTQDYLSKDKPGNSRIKEVDWVTGCGFLTRTDILRKTGVLEEKFFIYYEDVDLSFRIKKAGYRLMYHPESVIYHIAGMSNKSKIKQKEGYVNPVVHYLSHRNRIWLMKRYSTWYFMVPTVLYHSLYSLAFMFYFIVRGRFKKLNALLSGIRDGLVRSL